MEALVVVSSSWLCIFGCWQGSLCGCELSKVRELIRLVVNCFFFVLLNFGWIMYLNWLTIQVRGWRWDLLLKWGLRWGRDSSD